MGRAGSEQVGAVASPEPGEAFNVFEAEEAVPDGGEGSVELALTDELVLVLQEQLCSFQRCADGLCDAFR